MTTTTINIRTSKEVNLNELNWQNNRMVINYREDLYVIVVYNFLEVTVYYHSRRFDNGKVPACCKPVGKYTNIKSAQTQIKKFFRNW